MQDYKTVETLAPNPAGAAFAETINKLLDHNLFCVPVAQVEPARATTVGLGDAFVGGFLPALLS